MVRVDLAEVRRGLDPPGPADRDDWERIRELVRARLGEDLFAVWLCPLDLIAVDASVLVIAARRTRSAGSETATSGCCRLAPSAQAGRCAS